MNNFHTLPADSKRVVIEQTSLKQGLLKQIVEKDLWVSTLLEIIFTLPFADKLVFKGGTSLSKVWGLIDRFSEDIDLAVDRSLFGLEGDLTVRQLKKLRKASSLFVSNEFCIELNNAVERYGLGEFLDIEAQPNGEGDKTRVCPSALHSVFQAIAFAQYYTPNSRDTWKVSGCRFRVRLLPYKLQNYSCLRQIYE